MNNKIRAFGDPDVLVLGRVRAFRSHFLNFDVKKDAADDPVSLAVAATAV